MANTAQQMGASLSTALLNTIAATATAVYLTAPVLASRPGASVRAGLVHGYATAAGWAAAILVAAAIPVGVLVSAGRPAQSRGENPHDDPLVGGCRARAHPTGLR